VSLAGQELLTLLGAFVGSAFALVRFALGQARATNERFVRFLEGVQTRQEASTVRIAESLDRLGETVRDNAALLARVGERLGL
jgi:hypothetical protein